MFEDIEINFHSDIFPYRTMITPYTSSKLIQSVECSNDVQGSNGLLTRASIECSNDMHTL